MTPAPLPKLEDSADARDAGSEDEREALFQAEQVPVWGEKLPERALRLYTEGGNLRIAGKKIDLESREGRDLVARSIDPNCAALLDSDPDTYLAQVAWVLQLLKEKKCELWLKHPLAAVGYRVTLRDEQEFERWLDEAKPGKVRVIQRADGFELQTNVGKMAGPDPNGPTVPTRGGQLDIARLRRGLLRLKQRFSTAPDSCLVPSFGTEMASIAKALSGFFRGPSERTFEELCLVFPAPASADGG